MDNKLMQERLREMVLSDIENSSLSEEEKKKLYEELEACLEKHNQARILARRENREKINERILKRQLAQGYETSQNLDIDGLAENTRQNTAVIEETQKIDEIENEFIKSIDDVKKEFRELQSELETHLTEASDKENAEKYISELKVKVTELKSRSPFWT